MNFSSDTIAAISTAPGSSGIGIIRISGDDAFTIADKLFCRNKEAFLCNYGNFSGRDVTEMNSNEIRHGYVFSAENDDKDAEAEGALATEASAIVKYEIIDDCLLSKMCAPHTYTGENVVEVNCHGSFAVISRILSLVIKCGARPAEPGEFTKRAFLNGKLDLARAEAVMDVINSKTEQSRKNASMQLEGRLSRQINGIRESLIGSLSEIDVSIDYPEYEMDGIAAGHSMEVMESAVTELKKLSDTYDRGRLIKEGIKLVIAGCPNAGKSSLMNVLSGYSRAIVTDIPGTTRDTIEEFIQLDGIPITVTDTAGLRETEDIVEKIGVDKAMGEICEADLVIYVADCNDIADDGILNAHREMMKSENSIVILNKIDVADEKNIEQLQKFFEAFKCVKMSVKNGTGIEEFYGIIKEKFMLGEISGGSENIITNARHKHLIDIALNHLQNAQQSYKNNMPLDCISYDIWLCAERLGEILGKSVSDDVIDDIFKRFCVGK